MITIHVNGEAIDDAAIQREAAAIFKLLAERMPEENPATRRKRAHEWAEENLIEGVLLRQAALADPEPLELPEGCSEEAAAQLRLDRLVARIVAPASAPRHKDIVAFYLKNREQFHEPEKVRVAHIVKNVDEAHSEESAREGIELAQAELARGRAFGEIADQMSDCPGQGGALDWFSRGEMVKSFEDAVFGLKPDEVSGIIRSEFGFHIAKLLERRPEGVRRLEEVSDRISQELLADKKQKRLHQYVDALRARAAIQREEKNR